MGKLHELLAVEKTVTAAAEKLFQDTLGKFQRVDSFFQGNVKTLAMLSDSPENKAMERAARTEKVLPTTVPATLDYAMDFWAKAEDVLFQKNKTNQSAAADLEFEGKVIAEAVPVDELMGLEARLTKLRGLFATIPTLDASRNWVLDSNAAQKGTWVAASEDVTSKTEKVIDAKVLYEATEKHPAQVKEFSKDVVVGTFNVKNFSGAITAAQKARILEICDGLITEAKKSRVRANNIDACNDKIGQSLVDIMLSALK